MNRKIKIHTEMSANDTLLEIGANGYGEKLAQDGCGYPVIVQYYEGKLKVVIWDDINKETPSHMICLEGSREDKRINDVT